MVQQSQLHRSLAQFLAARPYYSCCILAHTSTQRLQHAADVMRADYNWPYLSVGAALSEALLPVAPQQRARIAFGSLLDAIRPFAPGPLVCADTDLLFEPALALDPLRLLRDASRLATIVVLWPGIAHNGSLSYAIAAHTHYRSWSHIDLPAECVISL